MSVFRYLSHYHPHRFVEKEIPVFENTCASLGTHHKVSKSSSVYENNPPDLTQRDKWIRNTLLGGLVYSAICISDYFLEARPIGPK